MVDQFAESMPNIFLTLLARAKWLMYIDFVIFKSFLKLFFGG